jgi:hypothetical protein
MRRHPQHHRRHRRLRHRIEHRDPSNSTDSPNSNTSRNGTGRCSLRSPLLSDPMHWSATRPMPDYLALVVCGAPLAARAHDVAALAMRAGWQVRVVATPSALNWLDNAAVESTTGFPALVDQRQPSQPKRFPEPAQVVVCPATFNSVNKLGAGIMDTYAAGILCETLASGTPMTVLPMVSTRLWDHPAWRPNLTALTAAGVTFVDIRTGRTGFPEPVESGTAPEIVAAFDPVWALVATRPRASS